MKDKGYFPREDIELDLRDGGLYPDNDDPNFIQQLLTKSEFADTVSVFNPNDDPCSKKADFEITPVQRFVTNLMSPRTPYMSALLYHGVGVGKTCAAIQAAESFLEVFPRSKVIIVAPKNIQQGFLKTIFDINKVVISPNQNEPNYAQQCTSNLYMNLTGTLFSKNKDEIRKKAEAAIRSRYEIYGYIAFSNHIKRILSAIPPSDDRDTKREREAKALRDEFSYRMIIIDEAHNLRDVTGVSEEEDIDTSKDDDNVEGKQLTPYLRALLETTEGIKFICMTATPMFNNVREIVFLLNLLLLNDKKVQITENQIFSSSGDVLPDASTILMPIVNAYVSYMRGENPNSFPVRLEPESSLRLTVENYPSLGLQQSLQEVVTQNEKIALTKLPIIMSEYTDEGNRQFMNSLTQEKILGSGTGYTTMNFLIQAGQCVFPSASELTSETPEQYIGATGFDACFTRVANRIRMKTGEPKWLSGDQLGNYAPKFATTLRSLQGAEGVCFVYSRYVKVGAYLMALILEANGYTRWKGSPLLAHGIQDTKGRQCATCSRRESEHSDPDVAMNHSFTAAYYTLLTGNNFLSPNNPEAITASTLPNNVDGKVIKVILGSQIAGEGLNLQFIREIHILDAWFHLNKTEQIIGRGQRFLSHCLLEKAKRNVTIFIHAISIGSDLESADLYAYRSALLKAQKVGKISRLLKIYAMDCHLRKGATVLQNLRPRTLIDSQGVVRENVDINDKQFTSICDWQECDYSCLPDLDKPIDIKISDDSTYDVFSAQYRISILKKIVERMFAKQTHFTQEELETQLQITKSPKPAIDMFLRSIINNKEFQIKHKTQSGYIIYKNTYYVFQPNLYKDLSIPLAIRSASIPVKRDVYSPVMYDVDASASADVSSEDMNIGNIKVFWELMYKWVLDLSSKTIVSVPKEVTTAVIQRTIDYPKLRDVFIDRLAMIVHMSKVVVHPEEFKMAVLEYIWDEWLSRKEQIASLDSYATDPIMKRIGDETYLSSGSIQALRFVNLVTNELEYICQGAPCTLGISEGFQRLSAESDPVKKRSAGVSTTGPLYGFIVPKENSVIFKTNVPHADGKKPKGGQECAIITAKTSPRYKLRILGKALEERGESNLNYDEAHLSAPAEINNTVKVCTLLDLGLRYLDHLTSSDSKRGLGGMRWFFRPIAAYWSGHKGAISKAVRKTLEKKE
jgi:hypothetical protein